MLRFRSSTTRRRIFLARFSERLCRCSQSVPSCITFLNIASGFAAFIAAWCTFFYLAAYFLIVAVLCDALDGAVARRFGLESRLGKELDSLADAVSFCIVPSFITILMSKTPLWYVVGAAFVYCCCGIFRLARFNVCTGFEGGRFFNGIPTTVAAFVIALALMPGGILSKFDHEKLFVLALTVVLLAFAMILPLRIPRRLPVMIRLFFLLLAVYAPHQAFLVFWIALIGVAAASFTFSRNKRKQGIKYVLR